MGLIIKDKIGRHLPPDEVCEICGWQKPQHTFTCLSGKEFFVDGKKVSKQEYDTIAGQYDTRDPEMV